MAEKLLQVTLFFWQLAQFCLYGCHLLLHELCLRKQVRYSRSRVSSSGVLVHLEVVAQGGELLYYLAVAVLKLLELVNLLVVALDLRVHDLDGQLYLVEELLGSDLRTDQELLLLALDRLLEFFQLIKVNRLQRLRNRVESILDLLLIHKFFKDDLE